MIQKMKTLWTELDREVLVNKREMALCLLCAALTGAVIGSFLSHDVTFSLGNHCGNHYNDNVNFPEESEQLPEEASEE